MALPFACSTLTGDPLTGAPLTGAPLTGAPLTGDFRAGDFRAAAFRAGKPAPEANLDPLILALTRAIDRQDPTRTSGLRPSRPD